MTEQERIAAEFKAWRKELKDDQSAGPAETFMAGWLAAKEDMLRTVRELGQALLKPKH